MRELGVYRVILEIHPRAPGESRAPAGGLGDPGWMGKAERNTPEASRDERHNTECV